MWPRWPPQRRQWISVRSMPKVRSLVSPTAFSSGCQKLGQPVPLSNLVSEENSGRSQPAQAKMPLRCSFNSGLDPGRSVPCLRRMSYCCGVSCARHSASLFSISNFSAASAGVIRSQRNAARPNRLASEASRMRRSSMAGLRKRGFACRYDARGGKLHGFVRNVLTILGGLVPRTRRSTPSLRRGALQSRGRTKHGVRYDPGSAKQRYALHRARKRAALLRIPFAFARTTLLLPRRRGAGLAVRFREASLAHQFAGAGAFALARQRAGGGGRAAMPGVHRVADRAAGAAAGPDQFERRKQPPALVSQHDAARDQLPSHRGGVQALPAEAARDPESLPQLPDLRHAVHGLADRAAEGLGNLDLAEL